MKVKVSSQDDMQETYNGSGLILQLGHLALGFFIELFQRVLHLRGRLQLLLDLHTI